MKNEAYDWPEVLQTILWALYSVGYNSQQLAKELASPIFSIPWGHHIKYALGATTLPIGISEYDLKQTEPDNFKGTPPTIQEIEEELGNS